MPFQVRIDEVVEIPESEVTDYGQYPHICVNCGLSRTYYSGQHRAFFCQDCGLFFGFDEIFEHSWSWLEDGI